MTNQGDLSIVSLTSARFRDLAALFEEGGDPKWCWCAYFRFRGRSWSNSTAAENRAALQALALEQDDHPAPGLIAYRDGRAVGWVSLGPRDDYERLTYSKVLAPLDDAPVWSIVCFVVSRRARGQGVAAKLLAAAVDYARERGATMLEGYPIDTSAGRVPSANAYHGTLSMFERAGFQVAALRQFSESTPVRPIVRLKISRDRDPG